MTHPKLTNARILLTSVFGPYAQDDEFGSRKINPMELYHNQVTREQGPFSLRMFHRSWGIMMIQRNISAPTTVLDFPTREAFSKELCAHRYDVVGISSIIVNVGKVREMCRMVREISPRSTIVLGGHVAAIPGIEGMVDADHIVRGDGIAWMRRFLGEDPAAPIAHPEIVSGFGGRALGTSMPEDKGSVAATIIPSVGCPMGCNFCTTSSFFGGKGKYLNFYDTGDELYQVMAETERKLQVRSFFMMDENFLLHRKRAMQLLEHMKREGKAWALYVFSSANAIRPYTMRELVELGVSWVWMGLESPKSSYIKLKDSDTLALTAELRRHGIKVLGSTIVGLEHHTPDNIRDEIEYAISHDTDFHQFMLYTPVPGTPLYWEMMKEAACCRMSTWRTYTASISSTSGTPPFRATSRRSCWIGPSAAITSATARASTASRARS
jgi:Radical SAM superfamily/B12 binding domain